MQNGIQKNNLQHQRSTIKPDLPCRTSQEDAAQNSDDGPPAKRRKVGDVASPPEDAARPISPPWKKIAVEGPTSFVEDGRRKSSRTNTIPLELQPQTSTRKTRAAAFKTETRNSKPVRHSYSGAISNKKSEKDHEWKSISGMRSSYGGSGKPLTINDATRAPPTVRHDNTKLLNSSQRSRRNATTHHDGTQDSTLHHRQHPTGISASPKEACQEHPQPPGTKSPKIPVTPTRYTNRRSTQVSHLPSHSKSTNILPQAKLQKIRFTVRMPSLVVQSPGNIPQPKLHDSFQDFLEKETSESKDREGILTTQEIAQEAKIRKKVHLSKYARGRLDQDLKQALPERQNEPKQYFHHDHLLAHVVHFRKLLHAERQKHKSNAKRVAYEAAKRARSKIPKSAEEIEQEQVDLETSRYREVVKDLSRFWTAVEAEVDSIRQDQIDKIEQARKMREFNEQVEKHTQMLAPRSNTKAADDESTEPEDDSDGSPSGGDEDMSTNDSGSEMNVDDADDVDAKLTADELRAKYTKISKEPSPVSRKDNISDIAAASSEPEAMIEEAIMLDEVAPNLLDDDSESIDTDDGEDSTESDSDNGSNESDDDGEEPLTLSSLLERAERHDSAQLAPPSDVEQFDTSSRDGEGQQLTRREQIKDVLQHYGRQLGGENAAPDLENPDIVIRPAVEILNQDHTSINASTPASPQTSMTKASDQDSFTSSDARADSQMPVTPVKFKESQPKTPVPLLFRGTLREYQHEGLDWLTNLYVNHRNGILADEMGLGKTIQTIALLARLAVDHQVWGPHLIIVPSSVLLNWEMEFKKFCPGFRVLAYYGNINERKQKRKGWMDIDLWHVVITSYQIVLQDQKNLKRRNWHYMVLDEAHNIKNFRSQRWQTMLTFKTRARLLLTGTPLQNNLTELWSLLFFLRPTDLDEGEDEAFAGLSDFSDWFKRPVDQILDHGRATMDDEARERVSKLHKVIRPYLLRRLKADVEKQMPAKYEHVELCRLSKRQRQLYDEFMSRSKTKDTLASGNYFSVIDCLMQLRKVCNHPDLFETRPVTTSFTLPRPTVADFEISDIFVRRKLLTSWDEKINFDFLRLAPVSDESKSGLEVMEGSRLQAFSQLEALRAQQCRPPGLVQSNSQSSISGVLASLANVSRETQMGGLEHRLYRDYYHHLGKPIYGTGLLARVSIQTTNRTLSFQSEEGSLPRDWDHGLHSTKQDLVHTVKSQAAAMEPLIQRFACVTPAVVASGLARKQLSEAGTQAVLRSRDRWAFDPFHEARTRLAIAFPDKRLLQYDCGKLQRLDKLLRQLQAGGHRALIFTQMTKVLDILEQFLNIHGHRYLRLDGSTKIEQRQILTERFNNDTQFLAFILSSRSGGLGINLTGADTVIFYDLDWNPAMDKQCQDRCHRIGQTRDVHIYRFVSEHTIESNILRKSNQKRMLDDVVIQEGDFTTDYLTKLRAGDVLDNGSGDVDDRAGAALEKVLGTAKSGLGAVLETAEDKEDIAAAVYAEREDRHADDGDFDEKVVTTPHEPNSTTSKKRITEVRILQQEEEAVGGFSGNDDRSTSAHKAPSSPSTDQAPFLDRRVRDLDAWVLESMIQWMDDDLGEIKADNNGIMKSSSSLAMGGRDRDRSKRNKKNKSKEKGGEHRIRRVR